MDSAKCIASAAPALNHLGLYRLHGRRRKSSTLHSNPHHGGTGSEMNVAGVITDWKRPTKKTAIGVPDLLARVVIVDPELTLTLPKRQVAAGGFDILTHLAEFYLTAQENSFINDGLKETMMKAVVKYLPIALAKPDNMEARVQLSWASTVAMSGLARVGDNLGTMACHGIEEAMSGRFDVCHRRRSRRDFRCLDSQHRTCP